MELKEYTPRGTQLMRSVTTGAACVVFAVASVVAQEPAAQAPSAAAAERLAYVDIQRVATESDEGKVANMKVEELSEQKLAELEARNKTLQGRVDGLNQQLAEQQQKLRQGQNVMSAEAQLSLQREISRLQLDVQRTGQDSQAEIERLTQDAEGEVANLQQQLQIDFQAKLVPIIERVAAEKGLSFIFSAGEGGLIWADMALDITEELIDELNAEAAGTP